jgi:flagellar hook-associated protein 2
MASFQSSVGLVTGLPITEIVDKLISVSAQPRDRLETRTAGLRQEQLAIGELMALTIATQMATKKLAQPSVFNQRQATSSNSDLLAATVTGNAPLGTYQFTPARLAQNHQLISAGVASLDQPLGEGVLTLGFGGFVDRGMDLELLNGGAGVERGRVRITDRSGASAVIDLRFALTVDDVLDQINRNDVINVTAVAAGGAIRLIDRTGSELTNLSVREVGGGSTAADLGLSGIDVAAGEATGLDLLRIYDGLNLGTLNDQTGLGIRDELPDLEITFRDGSSPLQINLNRQEVRTWGTLVDAINAADPTRLRAELSGDGRRLVLTDLTADAGGTFAATSPVGGTLAEDLGLSGPAAGNVLTGRSLLGGLKGPLLSSLAGGAGLGMLGGLSVTDRSGQTAVVDLASAETLTDVIDRINQAGVGVMASVNPARNGILLRDSTGATSGNLIVANADATNTADRLGLSIDAAQSSVDGGSLHLQVFHSNLRLDTLNNGQGVRLGSFLITDSNGRTSGVNLRTAEAETVGDVISLINGLGLAVEARINSTGDGLLLVDAAGGEGTLTVRESGTGTTAADLRLLGPATTVDLQGVPTQVIDGSTTSRLAIGATDTLQDVVDRINALNIGVTASVFQSGSGTTPYRIALSSQLSGKAGEIRLDAAEFGLSFHEIAPAQDALLLIGSADVPGAGVLAASSSNRFSDLVEGVQLTLGGVSDTPVSIRIDTADTSLVSNVKLLVDQYNKLRDKLKDLTFFDSESETKGILAGSNETLQIETRLARLLTGRFLGAGPIQSVAELGIGVDEDGKLTLDEVKLQERFAADPEAVEQFFTHEKFGFAARFDAVIESVAGEENSLLVSRTAALQRKIDTNFERIDFLTTRLERERERLLKYYYNLELAISKIQANMSVIESIAPMPLMIGGRNGDS